MASGTTVDLQSQNVPHCGETSTGISLDNTDTATFIRLYQQEELLWNVNLPAHTMRMKRAESLQKISQMMGKNWSIQQVKDKIMSLRSRYSKEIVKVRVSIASGADPTYRPIWRFFPMLDCFLRPFSVTRKTDTPVVRAFHKRLMGGMVVNQFQPSSPDPPVLHSHYDGPSIPSSHLLYPPDPANLMSASCYQTTQPDSAPVHLSGHDGDDDDDDVQILEEEDMNGMTEEVAMLVDDDGDSGYNGQFQEGTFASDSSGVWESGHDSRDVENGGSWMNSPEMGGGGGGNGSEGSVEEGGPQSNGESREQPGDDHDTLSCNSSSGLVTHTQGNWQVYPAPTVEGRPQCTDVSDQTETVTGNHHQTTPAQTYLKEETSEKLEKVVIVKQERPADPQSPPPPPLPVRTPLVGVTTMDSAVDYSVDSSVRNLQCKGSLHDNSTGTTQHLQGSCHDSKVRTSQCLQGSIVTNCDQTGKANPSSIEFHQNLFGEPRCKKIKKESESLLDVNTFQHIEGNGPSTSQLANETNRVRLSLSGSRISPLNKGSVSNDEIPDPSPPCNRQRKPHTTVVENHACESLQSYEPQTQMTQETVNPTPKELCDAATMASQVNQQVTDAVSTQMTNLLQTLVTNLTEKSSHNIGTEVDMAFVNYVKAELRMLDEDLQADVKFRIQKVIYEAQKEMSQRKSCDKHSSKV